MLFLTVDLGPSTHMSSQLPVTPVPGDLMPSSGFVGIAHKWHTDIYGGKTPHIKCFLTKIITVAPKVLHYLVPISFLIFSLPMMPGSALASLPFLLSEAHYVPAPAWCYTLECSAMFITVHLS